MYSSVHFCYMLLSFYFFDYIWHICLEMFIDNQYSIYTFNLFLFFVFFLVMYNVNFDFIIFLTNFYVSVPYCTFMLYSVIFLFSMVIYGIYAFKYLLILSIEFIN